jgi:RimJ/RimL family protein N-acetyltransferase
MRNAVLKGERIYLRPADKGDAETRARGAAEEPDTFMERLRFPASPIVWEQHTEEQYKTQPPETIELAVCLLADDRMIGSVELTSIDWVNRTAETGSWMDVAEFRGQGYGTEAKMLLLEYAFDHLQLHVLRSYVWEPNTRSAAALAKQGYRPAGRLYHEEVKDGVFRDALLFDILRDEWLAAREALRGARDAGRGMRDEVEG